jgi:hypothetical protein
VAYSTQRDNYLIDVQSTGTVFWMFPDILRSYCRVDIKYFPFDRYSHFFLIIDLKKKKRKRKLYIYFFILFLHSRQNCTLELQSWSRSKKEIIVMNDNEKPFLNHSFINTEWKLLNITVTPLEQNEFVWLEYMLHLKRNHAFYGKLNFLFNFIEAILISKIFYLVNHMIFPFTILSSLSNYIFILIFPKIYFNILIKKF